MKKAVLSAAVLAAIGFSAHAQTRFSVYEEFSGENCGPCAAYNPGLWTLMQSNTSKVMLLKYQVPIPSAGPLYNRNMTDASARATYYSVNSAPSAGLNGGALGNIASFTQAQIDAAALIASPFNISVTHTYSSDYDSVFATVNVTCVTAFAPTGANMKLRTAYVSTLEYPTPPGTNGEKEFHNVVQKMYPSAAGTSISNSWTVGQTQTFNISGPIQSFVDKSDASFVAVWIQNDADKSVAQAAKSAFVPMALDVAIRSVSAPKMSCASGSTASVANTAILTNKGTTPVTSATIYYRSAATGASQQYNWTGTLASNASATITLPAINTPAGSPVFVDSVGLANGVADYNPANNSWSTIASVINTTPNALPISTGFENNGADPANWVRIDDNGNGSNWLVAASSGNIGYNSSKYLAYHNNFSFAVGETNYLVFPAPQIPSGAKTVEFYVAYAQYDATTNDKLEVVYTTDCGTTWTSIWNKAGASLATRAATTNLFIPASNADWRKEQVDASAVPAGALVAFRAVSDYGNSLFIDNPMMRTGSPTGISQVDRSASARILPNPTHGASVLQVTMDKAANGTLTITDALGRMVYSNAQQLNAGAQEIALPTSGLAAGLYNVTLRTENGVITERLSVVK